MIRIPSYILIIGLIGIAVELYLNTAKRSRAGAVSKDRKSLPLIIIICTAAAMFATIAAKKLPAFQMPYPSLYFKLGAILIIFGLILRWYAIYQLGRFFTTKVVIATDHKLIESGPYRFIRHPSYTGSLLLMLGFAFCLQNWVSLFIFIIPISAVTLWRIHIEEAALLGAFGDQYRSYMQRTKRLIPLVY